MARGEIRRHCKMTKRASNHSIFERIEAGDINVHLMLKKIKSPYLRKNISLRRFSNENGNG
jgi:hypothetical protein